MTGNELLEKIKSSLDDLASMPHIASKALDLLNQEEPSSSELSKLFELDMVLTGKLLQMVNSAFYGLSKEVSTVSQAISILGFGTLRSTLISSIAFDMFNKTESSLIDPKGLWFHSLGTGLFSQSIAKEMKLSNVDDYFIAGLLHDIGKVILTQQSSDKFKIVLQTAKANRLSTYEVEEKILGTNHSLIGHIVCEHWSLPKRISSAIKYHHNISDTSDESVKMLSAVVQFSDFFCNLNRIGDNGSGKLSFMQKEAKKIITISADVRQKITLEVKQEIEKASEFVK